MGDPQLSKVVYRRYELLEKSARLLLLQLIFGRDVAEQLAIAAVLHDEEEASWRLDDLVQLDDMRVAHYLQDVNLAADSLHIVHISYFVFLENFDSHLQSWPN